MDEEFVELMEKCIFPIKEFDHNNHIRLAWYYLNKNSLPEAMIKFRHTLKRFASHHGKSEIYNETITFAYMFVIYSRLKANEICEEFLKRNSDLVNQGKDFLLKYYDRELLYSSTAKGSFIFPQSF